MANQWYFAREAQKFGPFTAAQLKELAAEGKVKPEDTVWKEGMVNRVPAAKVKDLFAKPQTAEAAAPPTAVAPTPPPAVAPEPELPASPPNAVSAPVAETPAESKPAPSNADAAPAMAAAPPPKPPAPAYQPPPPPKKRVVNIVGGDIASQDGVSLRYRKKCLKCGYAEPGITTMPIRSGTTRVNFFCRKCRKSYQIEIFGVG